MVAALPVTDDPFPPRAEVDPKRVHHTRRDTDGNVYGYFPGCKTEGMLGMALGRKK